MPKKLRPINPHAIPAHTSGRVKGTAFEIKCFPDSKSTDYQTPFVDPPVPGAAGDFNAWLKFFIDLVRAKLEKANGLQYDLDKGGPARANAISNELGLLADGLGMNRAGTVSTPPDLTWPLAGAYNITWAKAQAQTIGFDKLVIDLFFENEPDYRMAVNCSIALDVTIAGENIAPNSSGSSYIATSSSG